MISAEATDNRVARMRDRLEQAHHDLCTALTFLVSNGELLRRETEHNMTPPHRELARARLKDMDEATARLLRLAVNIRWHNDELAAE